MIDVGVIRELYRFNRWANQRHFEAIARVTADQFTKDLGGSYPSLRDTLLHIVWAEWIWLQRWKGSSPRSVFQPEDFPRLDAVREKWLGIEAEQRAFLETLRPEQLTTAVSYVNLHGQTWRYPLWRQMYHVVNHSTYHRGQLTTMLRRLGVAAPETDLLVFYDELEEAESRSGV